MKEFSISVPATAEADRVAFTARLVSTATNFVSDITIIDERNHIDLKSIMGMFTIVMSAGKVFTIVIDGADEDQASAVISRYFAE